MTTMRPQRFFAWILQHRFLVLTAAGVLVGVAGFGARHVRVDYGVEQFFIERGPQRELYDEYKRLFPGEDTRVSLFWKDHRRPGAALYRDMGTVAGWFEEVGLEDVRWFGNVVVAEHRRIDDEPGIAVGTLIAEDRVTDAAVEDALRRHRRDPLLEGFLWDTTQTVLLIHGSLAEGANTDTTRRRLDAALSERLATLRAEHGPTLVLTGLPIARARAPVLLEGDIRLLLGSAFVVFFGVLYWFFRHPAHVALSLVSVIPAYLCVLGVVGFLGKPISILTSFIPIVVLVVGMSDAVHILAHYRDHRARASSATAGIVETFAAMAGPCFYTSVTTAVGFAALAGTRIGIVVDFGLLTALAILLTFVFSMTVFPVLLSFVPAGGSRKAPAGMSWISLLIDAAVRRARRPAPVIVIATVGIALTALFFALRLRTDTYLIDDTKATAPFMQDIAWIDDQGFGFFQVNVLLEQDGLRPLHAPEALRWMRELRSYVEQDPLVTKVVALPDFLGHLRRAGLGPDAELLPTSLAESSQLLLMAQLNDPAFVDEVYLESAQRAQVIITVRDEGSRVTEPFLRRLDAHLALHPFPNGTVRVTGTVTMIHTFTQRLLQSFGPSIVIALVLITAIMMWMLGSVRLGLIALLPNVVPLIVVLGAMSVFGYPLKPSTILVLSIAFGMAVDNTIHLLTRVTRHTPPAAPLSAGFAPGLREAGAVLVVTTMIVTAGFTLLVASHFTVLVLIGLMTAVTAVTALVADLFVLPSAVRLAESMGRVARAPVPAKGSVT